MTFVLQSAFGDFGHTTFFIKSEEDFRRQHEHEIVGQGEIKVMKRIDCRGSQLKGCATSEGTIVGPLMTELVGFKDAHSLSGWVVWETRFLPLLSKKSPDRKLVI